MDGLQRAGGIAAVAQALAYVAGFALFLTVLSPPADLDAAGRLAFLLAHRAALEAAMLVTYVVTGVATVVLGVAVAARVKAGSPALAQVAGAFGLIWGGLLLGSGMVSTVAIAAVAELHGRDPAAAGALWRAVAVVQDGLGGGNEIVGGLWVALVSTAALRGGGLPRSIALSGLAIGLAGVLTTIPGLGALTDLFGLALIGLFAALGVAMLRTPTPA